MIDALLVHLAPHHCCGCGEIGAILCSNCKYNIGNEPYFGCIVCTKPSAVGICSDCKTTYDRAWCAGDREDVLERLINAYKFKRVKAAVNILASLLDQVVPVLPEKAIIVPVPTARSHVRIRGYDHTSLLAKEFARRRGLNVKFVVCRRNGSTQRGLNKKERMEQAEQLFYCNAPLSPDVMYVIIDDVVTTNATLRYVANALREAGAQTVAVAVVARQPLSQTKLNKTTK